jgi:DNA-binding CsgD family transcriptional regulator
MRDLARDAQYPARALEVIMQIHLAKDAPQLLDSLVNATSAIGAAASLYSVAIPEAGSEPSSFSLFACHPGFAQRQQRLGPLLHHPWFRFARTHSTPGTDQGIYIQHASDAEAVELARQYGFASCLIVPTAAGADLARLEMLCLGSDHEAAFEGEDARIVRTLARSLAAELHDWVTRHLSTSLQQVARLHKSDIELLKLERQGLSTKAISARTGMSRAAVDSRFQRLNARLECANRKASARRAAEYGLLESTG